MNNSNQTVVADKNWDKLNNAPRPQLDRFDLEAEAEGRAIARTVLLRSNKGKGHCGASKGGKSTVVVTGSGENNHHARRLHRKTA